MEVRRSPAPIFALTALLAACSSAQPVPDGQSTCPTAGVPAGDWELVDAGPFSVRMPPGFAPVDAQPIDSRAGAYRSASGDAEISYDYGWYSNDLAPDAANLSEQSRCSDLIGGKAVTVVVGNLVNPVDGRRYVVAGAWRNVEDSDPPVHLTVWSTARDSSMIPVLRTVLSSVDFEQ